MRSGTVKCVFAYGKVEKKRNKRKEMYGRGSIVCKYNIRFKKREIFQIPFGTNQA